MEIRLDTASGNLIRSYEDGRVVIGERSYGATLVVTPNEIRDDGLPGSIDELTPRHLEALLLLQPEVVLLGTGPRQRFPAPEVTAPLLARGVGVEVMDTGAACRTYNVLAAEGRRVAALLILG